MIKNLFLVTLRNIKSHKGYALINIFGLSIGLAASIFIFMYVQDELTFDTQHPHYQNLYGIGSKFIMPDGEEQLQTIGLAGWDNYLVDNYEGVVAAINSISYGFPFSLYYDQEDKIHLTQDGEFYFVEENYHQMLHTPILEGDKETPLTGPNTMIISKSAAKGLFGDINPVGEIISMSHLFATGGEKIELRITAVMDDMPSNIQTRPKYLANIYSLAPFQADLDQQLNTMSSRPFFANSYVQINDERIIPDLMEGLSGITREYLENLKVPITIEPVFRKVTDMHFDKERIWNGTAGSADKKYLYGFISIAVFILLIAGINYLNLSTARSIVRAREVGLRKTLGSSRGAVFLQFMVESFVFVFIAALTGTILVILLLPVLNSMAGKFFIWTDVFAGSMWWVLASVIAIMTFLAGFYPAVYISGLQPVKVLKGKFAFSKGSNVFRKFLIGVQFSISIIFLIITLVVINQMSLLRDTQLNESGSRIVSVRYSGFKDGLATLGKYEVFKNKLLQQPAIESVALSLHLPRQDYFPFNELELQFPEVKEDVVQMHILTGDYDFPKLFKMRLLTGRFFDKENPGDSNSFLINEAGLKLLDLTVEEAVGQPVIFPVNLDFVEGPLLENSRTGKIIGVVEDFSYESMRHTINPAMISSRQSNFDRIIYVRAVGRQVQDAMASIETIWKEVYPDMGIDTWFIDDEFNKMYKTEGQVASMIEKFAIMTIIILCVGLYGLASFMTRQKTKEIGIRKAMGSTNGQILLLMLRIYVPLLLVACLAAVPVGLLVSREWLSEFVYRIDLGPGIFIVSVLSIALITLLTVIYEALKSSRINPAVVLKND